MALRVYKDARLAVYPCQEAQRGWLWVARRGEANCNRPYGVQLIRTVLARASLLLPVDMRYDLGRVYIRHVLTHAEYARRTQIGTL